MHSMLRSALPWKSRCMSPLPIAVDRRQPSPPHSRLSTWCRSPWSSFVIAPWDLAAQTGLGPLRMTARVRGTPSAVILAPVAVRMNAMRNETFLATPLPTGEGPVIGFRLLADILTSQASPPRLARSGSLRRGRLRHHGNDSLHEGHPLLSECASLLMYHSRAIQPLGGHLHLLRSRFASRRSPASSQERFASRRSPRFPRGARLKGVILTQANGIRSRRRPSSSRRPLSRESRSPRPHSSRDTFSQRKVPLPLNDDAMSRGTRSLLINITHLELRLESLLRETPFTIFA